MFITFIIYEENKVLSIIKKKVDSKTLVIDVIGKSWLKVDY